MFDYRNTTALKNKKNKYFILINLFHNNLSSIYFDEKLQEGFNFLWQQVYGHF